MNKIKVKGLFLTILLVLGTIELCAQVTSSCGFKHVIEVRKFSDWGKDYLTVTNSGLVFIGNEPIVLNARFSIIESHGDDSGPINITPGELITEVNGISTKGWTPERFYSVVDKVNDTVVLTLLRRLRGGDIIKREVTIYTRECDSRLSSLSYTFKGFKGKGEGNKPRDWLFEQRHDEDFDFFFATRYDIAIDENSDDPILDKNLVKYFQNIGFYEMVRDENHPDVIFTISRSVDQSITSTYVPPSYRTVNTGSTTTARYNWFTGRYEGSTTREHTRTVKDGDYTVTNRSSDIYLEIAALDAKKVNDPKQTYAPIVWKAVVRYHTNKTIESPEDYMKGMITIMDWPIDDRLSFSESEFIGGGIIINQEDPFLVDSVIPNTLAEAVGLKPGDRLVKNHSEINKQETKVGKNRVKQYNKWKKKNFERGWYGTLYPFWNGYCVVGIDKKIYPFYYGTDSEIRGWIGYIASYFGRFVVQRKDGSLYEFDVMNVPNKPVAYTVGIR